MNKEIWKDIPVANGYEASSLGKIRNKKTKHIIKQFLNDRGYVQVGLYINGKKSYKVHRLVANAFLNNPNNYKTVNHINGNKLDNNVNNLEYCSITYNLRHAFKNGLKNNNHLKKRINQYDLNNNLVKKWNSQKDIVETLGFSQAVISNCCRGKLKTAYGYIWKHELKGDSNE